MDYDLTEQRKAFEDWTERTYPCLSNHDDPFAIEDDDLDDRDVVYADLATQTNWMAWKAAALRTLEENDWIVDAAQEAVTVWEMGMPSPVDQYTASDVPEEEQREYILQQFHENAVARTEDGEVDLTAYVRCDWGEEGSVELAPNLARFLRERPNLIPGFKEEAGRTSA